MKTIYFLLVFVVLFGFIWSNEASGQCEVCQYPYLCSYIDYTVECNGQTFPIQAVICYNCDNNNRAYYVQVLELSYPAELERIMYDPNNPNYNPQCEDALWDNLWLNIRSKAFELCGYVGCPNKVTIYKTFPICGEFIYEGPPGHEFIRKRFHPGACNLRCVVELRVCYDYDTQSFIEEIVSTEYFGECPIWARYPGEVFDLNTSPFRIDCAQLFSSRYCPWP